MNQVKLAGAILSIIGSCFTIFFGVIILIVFLAANVSATILDNNLLIIFLSTALGLSSITLITSILAISTNSEIFRIISGTASVFSLFFVWICWIVPFIVTMLGSIIILFAKKDESIEQKQEEKNNNNKYLLNA